MAGRTRRFPSFFAVACVIEGGLVLVAAALAYPFGRPVFSDLHWSAGDLLLGLAASAPLYVLFRWMLRSPLAPLARIRHVLATLLYPLVARCSLLELGVISALAGIGEEVLFRSVVQGTLSTFVGPTAALIAASVLFGCAHLVTLAYGVIAAALGAYLGWLWLLSENLLVPVVAHAAYDFAALVYLIRAWRPGG